MTRSTKFFEDNISRVTAHSDPLAWNLNYGLLELSKEIARLQAEQAQMKSDFSRALQRLEHQLQQVQSQMR